MVAKVARLHFQPATPTGALRAAFGWVVALGGLIVLAARVAQGLGDLDWRLADALLGGIMSAGATALGAVPMLVTRSIGARTQGLLLGAGGGVMLAAAVFSLLLPGFEAAAARWASPGGAAAVAAAGLLLGALALLGLDRALPHRHAPDGQRSATAVWLFVLAIALHNIPEGLAIGVAAGGAGGNAVATGISLQNVPEGLIVAIALATAGYGRGLAFAVAALSGLVEPFAAVVASALVGASNAALPWALTAAAGAMLFVVSHEIIPESRRQGHDSLASGGLIGGFAAMMLIDSMVG